MRLLLFHLQHFQRIFLIGIFSLYSSFLLAQHEGHGNEKDTSSLVENHHNHHGQAETTSEDISMSHSFSRSLPMNRNGSGTAWLPDASPMYGYMKHTKSWMFMFHGNIFLRYNNQDIFVQGSRGGNKIDAPNWFMGMGQRKIGSNGLFRFGVMISLDPLTVGGEGYPLLFQSGETWEGKPLVDRQHPHDLLSELSVGYSHRISTNSDVFLYLGYPGEPAFGPVAFMHRVSSLYNPDAPLGHHWQDATHITFGVATIGFRYKNWKLEGSSFTGREPNEDRYDFDRPRFDSWSARLSYNPISELALQVSQAKVKSPHELSPEEDLDKTTASITYSKKFGSKTFWNSTGLWGYNYSPHHHKEHSALIESAFTLFGTTFYGKYEWVQKSVEELVLDDNEYGHNTIFAINAFTFGMNQNLYKLFNTHIAIGAQGTLYRSDKKLENLYGRNPIAFETYIRIYPEIMSRGYYK